MLARLEHGELALEWAELPNGERARVWAVCRLSARVGVVPALIYWL